MNLMLGLALSVILSAACFPPSAFGSDSDFGALVAISKQPSAKYKLGETLEISARSLADVELHVFFSIEERVDGKWVDAGQYIQGRVRTSKTQPMLKLPAHGTVKDSWTFPKDATKAIGNLMRCRLNILVGQGKDRGKKLESAFSSPFEIIE